MGVKVSIKAKRNSTRRICNNIFIFVIEFERKTQTDIFFPTKKRYARLANGNVRNFY